MAYKLLFFLKAEMEIDRRTLAKVYLIVILIP